MNTLTGRPMAQELKIVMRGLAARDFRRRHPRATEAAAWRFAMAHAADFREQAVTALALLHLERETAQEAQAN